MFIHELHPFWKRMCFPFRGTGNIVKVDDLPHDDRIHNLFPKSILGSDFFKYENIINLKSNYKK